MTVVSRRDAEFCCCEVKTDGKDGFSNCAISTGDHIIAHPVCLTPTPRYTIKMSEQLPIVKMGRGPSWRLKRAINPCGRPPKCADSRARLLCLRNRLVRLQKGVTTPYPTLPLGSKTLPNSRRGHISNSLLPRLRETRHSRRGVNRATVDP